MASCRFAPSPSGRMHLGNVYSAVAAWLIARKNNLDFIVRFEDIDERSKDASNAEILLDDLRWVGLDWDSKPVKQSERFTLYEDAFNSFIQKTHVYPCFCSRADLHASSAPHASDGVYIYSNTCKGLSAEDIARKSAIKNPAYRISVNDEIYSFEDQIMGFYSENLKEKCGDFIIRRSDGIFAYQLCVVVDDEVQNVSSIVRGADLISSTPRQLYLRKILGYSIPLYYHHPVLHNNDNIRLSKRDKAYDMGLIRLRMSAQELIGWIAYYLGQIEKYTPLTLEELVSIFDLEKVPKQSAIIASAFEQHLMGV